MEYLQLKKAIVIIYPSIIILKTKNLGSRGYYLPRITNHISDRPRTRIEVT